MRAEVELYARRRSPVHDWDARWKLAAAGVLAAVLVSLQRPGPLVVGLVLAAGGLALARLPARLVLGRLGAAQIILLPCVIILPLSAGGEVVTLGPLALSREGLRLAGVLYLRALALVTLGLVVVYSTPMVVLLRALQAFRLPRVLVELTLLTYRYLFTLGWELTRLRQALAARGFRAGGRLRDHRTLAQVVGVTLVRSVERTERIQLALRGRGFEGRLRTLQTFHPRPADRLKTLGAVVLAAALLVWERSGGAA